MVPKYRGGSNLGGKYAQIGKKLQLSAYISIQLITLTMFSSCSVVCSKHQPIVNLYHSYQVFRIELLPMKNAVFELLRDTLYFGEK